MLTKNVHYTTAPDKVMVLPIGGSYDCRVDFPVNVQEGITPEGEKCWMADVWSLTTLKTAKLKERIERSYDTWLARAQEVPTPTPTIDDVIEAVNELTELVLAGMEG